MNKILKKKSPMSEGIVRVSSGYSGGGTTKIRATYTLLILGRPYSFNHKGRIVTAYRRPAPVAHVGCGVCVYVHVLILSAHGDALILKHLTASHFATSCI
eukprot:GHVT01082561.1.p1 GENE.GHVT01082561.1~~GHVT01082561.1.p1  ORF type:complete len:100 (-),score=2.36 GHVT01082561.1:4597-4896(-)